MISKTEHINRELFGQVLKRGRRMNTKAMSIVSLPSADGRRIGVVISKKVAKNATDRNLLRRRLYAILSQFVPQNCTAIVITKPIIGTYSYKQLLDEVQGAFSQFGSS